MAKASSPIRSTNRRTRPLSDESIKAMGEHIDGRLQLMLAKYMLASLETLRDEFQFTSDQILKFQEVTQAGFKSKN